MEEFTEVYVWGHDSSGQLGISTSGESRRYALPKCCSFNIVIRQISCGYEHTGILTNEGFVYTMGSNVEGRLGLGNPLLKNSFIPCLVEGLVHERVIQVSCGQAHSLAVTEAGDVYSWGANDFGQLGLPEAKAYFSPQIIEYFTTQNVCVHGISSGAQHSGFVCKPGRVYLCGANEAGQLGLGDYEGRRSPTLSLVEECASIECGIVNSYILSLQGEIWATGLNNLGQLGLEKIPGNYQFVKITTLEKKNIAKISSGYHTAALTMDGSVYAWGEAPGSLPKLLKIKDCVDISVGGAFALALDSSSRVWGWGANSAGELGTGDAEPHLDPAALTKLDTKNVRNISCGSCAAIALGQDNYINVSKMGITLESQHENILSKSNMLIKTSASQTSRKLESQELDSNSHLLELITKQRDYLEETVERERIDRNRAEELLTKKFETLRKQLQERLSNKEAETVELENNNLLLSNLLKEKDRKIQELIEKSESFSDDIEEITLVKKQLIEENKAMLGKLKQTEIERDKDRNKYLQEVEKLLETVRSFEKSNKLLEQSRNEVQKKLEQCTIQLHEVQQELELSTKEHKIQLEAQSANYDNLIISLKQEFISVKESLQ